MLSLGAGMPQTPITTPTYALEFQKAIEAASLGRDVHTIQVKQGLLFMLMALFI